MIQPEQRSNPPTHHRIALLDCELKCSHTVVKQIEKTCYTLGQKNILLYEKRLLGVMKKATALVSYN